ncbi:transmembrane epididymal protein 1-like [Protopterus annectens]|uniref:transmembrane epididymal protein 1-like n=1 Tax=Protopterus annectens TaxID=7888 RepID=UPI001CF9F05A|nr:transmembrane epididymal protein 1-like [Protopterus annectens]
MGTFIGHISPGLAFLSFGILYAFRLSRIWLQGNGFHPMGNTGKQQPGRWGCIKRIPVEGIMKIIYGTLAVLGEFFFPPGTYKLILYDRTAPDAHFMHPNEWQHVTMYSYFAISGWVDILSQVCLPKRLLLIEHLALSLAFYTETLLIAFHTHGKEVVEKAVHFHLLIACLVMCVILTVEFWRPEDPVLWFTKTCLVMIQGTWLLHAAFILYKPPSGKAWKDEDMSNLMFVTNFFSWHILLNLVLFATIFGITKLFYKFSPNSATIVKRHQNGEYKFLMNGLSQDYTTTTETINEEETPLTADHF